ncbi:MAG: efflux RND transporter periplasmic adaptor subunit [Cyclobacteriaceae bacterium]
MDKRQILISVLGVVILLGAFGLTRILTSGSKEPPKEPPKSMKSVRVIEVTNQEVPGAVNFTGRLNAKDKIEIFAEVGGVLLKTQKPFKPGTRYNRGETLLVINNDEARLDLISQKSNLLNLITQLISDLKFDFPDSYPTWQEYLSQFDINNTLQPLPEPASEKERYFIAARNIYNTYYTIKSAESRLAKYSIRAPFNGSVSQSNVNPGALVRVGQQLGSFINEGEFELEASLSISALKNIKQGDVVTLRSADVPGSWTGKVIRISDAVDPSTQSFQAFISLKTSELKEGMYLSGSIATKSFENSFKLPRNVLVGQDQVYVIRDSAVALQPVKVMQWQEDSVIVGGLENQQLVVNESLESTLLGQPVKPYQAIGL